MKPLNCVIAAFVVAAPSVFAADWREFADAGPKEDKHHMALDVESVRRQDGQILAWVRVNQDRPKTIDGKQYRSALALYRIDCAGLQLATLQASFHSARDGKGAVVQTNDWSDSAKPKHAAPETLGGLAMKFACVVAETR